MCTVSECMCTVSECMCTVSECMCTVANISAMYEYAHAHCCVVRADGWNQGCQCPSPYSGETCEVVDICANVDCGHGTCSPDGDGKTWIEYTIVKYIFDKSYRHPDCACVYALELLVSNDALG